MSNSGASTSTSMEDLRAQDAEGFACNEPVELTSCQDISAPDNLIDNLHLDICTPASSMDELFQTLKQSSMLPAEWMCSLLSSKLALFKLALVPPMMIADVTMMLTISADGTWLLTVGRKQALVSQCPVLEEVPTRLLSVEEIVRMLSALEKARLCVGNPDEKFKDLAKKRDGEFRNHAGC